MPIVNFPDHNESAFNPVPEGEYEVEVVKIEPRSTYAGDEMWGLHLRIVSGPHAGRKIFDNMVFSEAAMNRVKLICSRLGIDVSKQMDLTENMLLGKHCIIKTVIREYEDRERVKKLKNEIPFAGYKRIDSPSTATTPAQSPDTPPPTINHLIAQISRIGLDLKNEEHLALMQGLNLEVTGKKSSTDLSDEDIKRLASIMTGLSSVEMVKQWITWSKNSKATEEKPPF